MANELSKAAASLAGKTSPAKPDAPVAAAAKPAAPGQPAVVGSAAGHSVPLFGGHRGGGKKRKDGLPAGSNEAIAADREKNAERMRQKRAAQKVAALPPALPSVAATAPNPNLPSPVGGTAVPGVAAGPAVPPTPLFVGWSEKILARPAKLLIRIVDRLRCSSLMKRVRRLGLKPEQKREIADDLRYKDELVNDFSAALSVSAATELNHWQVPGAKHSHWIDTAMLGGEAALVHLNCLDKLEKLIAENAAAKAEEARKNTVLPPVKN